MTKCKKPMPYDPKLIAERCNPLALRLGCAAGCWKGENVNLPNLTVGASVPFAEMIASGMAT